MDRSIIQADECAACGHQKGQRHLDGCLNYLAQFIDEQPMMLSVQNSDDGETLKWSRIDSLQLAISRYGNAAMVQLSVILRMIEELQQGHPSIMPSLGLGLIERLIDIE